MVYVYPASDKSRCPVHIVKKYLNLLPPKMCQKLHLRPRAKFTPSVWFGDQPYGNHRVTSTVKKMCANAGFVGKYTNHSLRATSASRMFANDIPEQVIKEITGHHSEAVRTYKRTPDNIRERASSTITGGECSSQVSNECKVEEGPVESNENSVKKDESGVSSDMRQ